MAAGIVERGERSIEGYASGRVPPSDVEAEKAVLSAILLDNDAIHLLVTELRPDDFYHPSHRLLYQAMIELRDANQPVDLTTLADHLLSGEILDRVGGPMMLAEIADFEATAANALHYARIIRDKSIRRHLISVSTEIAALGFEHGESADTLLDEAESKIFALSQEKASSTLTAMSEGMHDAMNHIDTLMNRSGELTGLPTGFSELDKSTGGFQPGDLIILAARPSMGKTALALNIARNAAVDYAKKVAIFSLEMTTRSLVLRMLSAEAKVDSSAFRNGMITPKSYEDLSRVAGDLAKASVWIDDTGAATVLEIRAKSRRLHAQHGLDLVVVDYLQLAHGDKHVNSREQEISEISRGLKGLAKELNIPVLALSQLNRGPETRREDKRPVLSDLRESGAIEQDADIIAFIYRDIVYNEEAEHPDLAELIIRKQRNGPTGTVKLEFLGRYARFQDWTQGGDPYGGAPGGGGFTGGGGFGADDQWGGGSDEPFV